MDFSDFRSRAIAEGRRYGKDELVFLREFAQNGRDAGATDLTISTHYEAGNLAVTYTDNGVGMSFAHAKKYLFTLYASSKETEQQSAGQFGVGFWSILLFGPQRIVIMSKTAFDSWGVEFSQELDYERNVPSRLSARGTSVTATKQMSSDAAFQVRIEIEEGLQRYCKYLRQKKKTNRPIHVSLNGKRIDEPMVLHQECNATFQYSDVQGAVALGKTPKVSLFVRGLPVWIGTDLSELQYGAKPKAQISYPKGLAPVYLINGNKLCVTLDRRSVFDDGALKRTRSIAQREMRKLVANTLDSVAPRTLRSRWEYLWACALDDWGHRIKQKWIPTLSLLTFAVLIVSVLTFFFPSWPRYLPQGWLQEKTTALISKIEGKGGLSPTANYEKAQADWETGEGIALLYEPKQQDYYFRVQVVEKLDVQTGAKSGELLPYRLPANYHCTSNCVSVSIVLENNVGAYHLPVPSGHYVDKSSIVLAKGLKGQLVRSKKDDWLFIQSEKLQTGTATIGYTAGPTTGKLQRKKMFVQRANVSFPPLYLQILREATLITERKRQVSLISNFVQQSIAYDTTGQTVARYRNFFSVRDDDDWYRFVFTLKKGDCDVKNIIAVAMLRELGIPARLAVGYVGKNGTTLGGKHAWIEYYDEGWQLEDATGAPAINVSSDVQPPEVGSNTEPVLSTGDASNIIDSAQHVDSEPAVHFQNHNTEGSFKDSPPSGQPFVDGERPQPNDSFEGKGGAWDFHPIWGWFLLGSGGLVFLFLLIRWHLRNQATTYDPTVKQENLAAQMLQAVMENTQVNPKGSGLYSRALIPTWNGKRISLNKVVALRKRAALFYSAVDGELVQRLVKARHVVVKVENTTLLPIVSRFPKNFDVAMLETLKPVSITDDNENRTVSHQVISNARKIADAIGMPKNVLVPVAGDIGTMFVEMDISMLPFLWKNNIPTQFIAVSLRHLDRWQQLAAVVPGVEEAGCLLLDTLALQCQCLIPYQDDIRHQLAIMHGGKQ